MNTTATSTSGMMRKKPEPEGDDPQERCLRQADDQDRSAGSSSTPCRCGPRARSVPADQPEDECRDDSGDADRSTSRGPRCVHMPGSAPSTRAWAGVGEPRRGAGVATRGEQGRAARSRAARGRGRARGTPGGAGEGARRPWGRATASRGLVAAAWSCGLGGARAAGLFGVSVMVRSCHDATGPRIRPGKDAGP